MSVLEPGAIFGRDFRIVRALREGGMGAVYIADQLSTGKQRALKVMAPELAADPPTRERFVLEARAASRIESDHVVEIVTAGVDEQTGAPYLVMELLRGEELADAAARLGPLPLGDVAEILAQVGHALEQAHLQGIVHRDLKPENIFLCTSRRRDVAFTAKVLDFGIAKLVADSQKTGTQPLGTPLFMSPEQTDRRGRICPATDVWALGLIAFRLLTGRDYWLEADGSLPMLLREICVDPIGWASVRAQELAARPLEEGQRPVAQVPPGFDAWFARCVNRDIDARFAHAGEAVRAFAELVTADAQRGVLVLATGPVDWTTSSGQTGPFQSGPMPQQSGPQQSGRQPWVSGPQAHRVAPAGATFGSADAATGSPMIQGAPFAAPAPPGSGAGKVWIAVAVVGLAAGGFAAFRLLGAGGSRAAPPGSASVGPTAAGSVAAPSPPPSAAAAPGKCPEGAVLIDGGKMFMGARDLTADAKPPHEVMVSRFCLDRTEVTTKAYMACVEKGECERPPEKVSWPGIKEPKVKHYSPLCNAGHADRAEHPINCVAWPMADTYCTKRGARLPTEAEWEYAARGSGQRKYPWGDDPPGPRFLNACGKECVKWGEANDEKLKAMYDDDDGWSGTAPVGSFPAGASAFGVLDLAGNVWEWTADWYGPYTPDLATDPRGPATGDKRVVRGGDFTGAQPDWARPAYRWKTDPDTYNHAIGFRCAANPK